MNFDCLEKLKKLIQAPICFDRINLTVLSSSVRKTLYKIRIFNYSKMNHASVLSEIYFKQLLKCTTALGTSNVKLE